MFYQKFSLPTIKPVISNDILQSSTEKKVAAPEVIINHRFVLILGAIINYLRNIKLVLSLMFTFIFSVTKEIVHSEDDKAKNVDFHELPSLSLNDKVCGLNIG
jgi:hypothetical protein